MFNMNYEPKTKLWNTTVNAKDFKEGQNALNYIRLVNKDGFCYYCGKANGFTFQSENLQEMIEWIENQYK